jgi:hypothetical protein
MRGKWRVGLHHELKAQICNWWVNDINDAINLEQ